VKRRCVLVSLIAGGDEKAIHRWHADHRSRRWPRLRRLCWAQHNADYIQLYHGNASLLIESLEVIQQASAVILAALQPPTEEQAEMPDAELAQVA
jgi:hypothetical protein